MLMPNVMRSMFLVGSTARGAWVKHRCLRPRKPKYRDNDSLRGPLGGRSSTTWPLARHMPTIHSALKAVHIPQEADARSAQVSAQLREARKAWDDERASLQAKVAEGQEQRNSLAARETQACDRANALQAQLQAAETARGKLFSSPFACKASQAYVVPWLFGV